MPHIAIISASVRLKRNSHRVALYLKRFLEENSPQQDHIDIKQERT